MTHIQRAVEDYRKRLEQPVRCVDDMLNIEIPGAMNDGCIAVDKLPS